MEIAELQKIIEDISPEELASEFLEWLIQNVEQYMDNHKTQFILNISPKEAGGMPLAERIEELYLGLDDENVEISMKGDEEFDWGSLDEETRKSIEEETKKLMVLHELVEKAYKSLLADADGLSRLFKALSYYYELVGFRDGIPIEKELGGRVNIGAFHYEAVSVPVEIKGKQPVYNENGDLVEVREVAGATYIIPPSFVIDLEVEMFEKRIPTSLF